MNALADASDGGITEALNLLCLPGMVHEFRVIKDDARGLTSINGYFRLPDHNKQFVEACHTYNDSRTIYMTINPVNTQQIARGIGAARPMDGATGTKNHEILQRVWLPIDLDARTAHAEKRAATDAELALVEATGGSVKRWLINRGVPSSCIVSADSGNGGHLLIRINLPNDDDARDLVKGVLRAIKSHCETDDVEVDEGNYNAARIWKVYGTVARKGQNTPATPHRLARLRKRPIELTVCPLKVLHKIADMAPPLPTPAPRVEYKGGDQKFDIDTVLYQWFPRAGSWVRREGFRMVQLNECVFNADHDDVVIQQFDSGALEYACLHNSCRGRKWQDVRSLFDKDYAQRQSFTAASPSPTPQAAEAVSTKAPHLRVVGNDEGPTDSGGGKPSPTEPRFNDVWNAAQFAADHAGHTRWCKSLDDWLVFDGQRWSVDNTEAPSILAEQTVWNMVKRGHDTGDVDLVNWASNKCLDDTKIVKMLKRARGKLAIAAEDLDTEPLLLNTTSGTYDLRADKLLPHDPTHLLTKITGAAYNPDAECPLWESAVSTWFGGDAEMIAYIQRVCGYLLTGLTTEHAFWIMYGEGSNGKTVFIEVMKHVLGLYAKTTPYDSFLKRQVGAPTYDLAVLQGARMVVASEFAQGSRLNEAVVKNLTGGDTVVVRHPYGRPFEMTPTFKVMLVTNHEPTIRETDEGIWRRVKLVKWDTRIPDKDADRDLTEKLRGEADGILRWCVDGYRAFKKIGLRHPDKVTKVTQEYRQEQDFFAQWMADCCVFDDDVYAAPTVLHASLKAWCEANGEKSIPSVKAIGQRLKTMNLSQGRRGSLRAWMGIGLRDGNGDYTTQTSVLEEEDPTDEPPPQEFSF